MAWTGLSSKHFSYVLHVEVDVVRFISLPLLGTQSENSGLSSKHFSYVLHMEVTVVRGDEVV